MTLPKLREVEETSNCATAVVPTPDTPIAILVFDAFEVTVTLPLALPAVVGANVALKVALCPAARVTGAVIPLKLNPVPLIVI